MRDDPGRWWTRVHDDHTNVDSRVRTRNREYSNGGNRMKRPPWIDRVTDVVKRLVRRQSVVDVYDECYCGKALTSSTVHRIVDVQDDGETGTPESGYGTALVADFCDEHCPGGCKRGCKRTDKLSGYDVARRQGD